MPSQEIEIKLPVESAEQMRVRLLKLGFGERRPRTLETNIIFDNAEGLLRRTGRLLRLRVYGEDRLLTLKAPAQTAVSPYKIRQETEVVVSDGEAMVAVLLGIGFHQVFRYEKYRTEFVRPEDGRGKVLLDETPMGSFLEIEGPPEFIDETAGRLGFSPADYISGTYGDLWMEFCRRQGRELGDMTFGPRASSP